VKTDKRGITIVRNTSLKTWQNNYVIINEVIW
jgi:hypothetical protein